MGLTIRRKSGGDTIQKEIQDEKEIEDEIQKEEEEIYKKEEE